jgi:hypothetical protein
MATGATIHTANGLRVRVQARKPEASGTGSKKEAVTASA